MGLPAIAFAAACALSLAALADVPPPSGAHPLGSPALEDVILKFNDSLTFHAAFDGTPNASIAVGDYVPKPPKALAYVPGKAGKALADGTVVFPGEGNLDGRAGAAALWVEMSRSGLTPKDEGAFSPLALELQESAYRICKMHDGSLFSYFQEGGGGPGKITKTVHTWVSSKNWKKGEWHLLALAWSPGSIRMSVDGRPFVANNTMPGIADKAARITVIAAAPQEAKVAVAIDELMIFNRPLSNDEINWLWNTMGKYEPLR